MTKIEAASITIVNLTDGRQVLLSYGAIVAAYIPMHLNSHVHCQYHTCLPTEPCVHPRVYGHVKTDRRFSVTTSRHVGRWQDDQRAVAKTVPHKLLLELCAPIESKL